MSITCNNGILDKYPEVGDVWNRMKKRISKRLTYREKLSLENYHFRELTPAERTQCRDARLGMILSVLLNAHSTKIYKTFQQMMAVEFWRQGTSQKVFNLCTFIGLSQGANTARARVDKLVLKHDEKIKQWQSSIEVITAEVGVEKFESGIYMYIEYLNMSNIVEIYVHRTTKTERNICDIAC